MMKRTRQILVGFLSVLGICLTPCQAEVVVVMGAKSGVDRMTQDQVVHVFMGRYRKLDSGLMAVPLDLPVDNELRAEFYRKLVDKNLSEINAYWTRLNFSGKTSPPGVAPNADRLIEWLSSNHGGIGYIDAKQVDARVRVVFRWRD